MLCTGSFQCDSHHIGERSLSFFCGGGFAPQRTVRNSYDAQGFLSGGSSTDPISLLKLAGVDMSTPAPVDAALAMFGKLVDELDALTR